jgi:alpha-ketoglutarate-dependent taurine dioxygenase
MTSVIVKTQEELRRQRDELLDRASTTYDGLRERAESYQLTPEERNIWETLRTIDYLLGDG